MGLPWIRLDTSMPDNPKILGLLEERDGHRAAFVWVCCMAYAGKHGTDGFIPKSAARFIHGRASDFARLVDVSALKVVPGGWEIPGWDEFQVSDEAAKARRDKAQKAAAVRWSKTEHATATRKQRREDRS
jgi:hypothetical protein